MQEIAQILMDRYRGDPGNMTGPAAAADRQRVLELLSGKREPKSRCGVNRVERALLNTLSIQGGCMAERRQRVRQWAAAQLATA